MYPVKEKAEEIPSVVLLHTSSIPYSTVTMSVHNLALITSPYFMQGIIDGSIRALQESPNMKEKQWSGYARLICVNIHVFSQDMWIIQTVW